MESVARVASASRSAAVRAVSPFDGLGLAPGQDMGDQGEDYGCIHLLDLRHAVSAK